MRMVVAAGFADTLDVPDQLLVALRHNAGVLVPRDNLVRISVHVQERYRRFREWLQAVHRVLPVGEGLGFGGGPVVGDELLPVAEAAGASALAAGPALEVAHRRVAV